MTRLVTIAVLALTLMLAAAPVLAQGGRRGTPQTEQTVDVTRGYRFTLESHAGAVIVHAWEKDAVRVRAWHAPGEQVKLRTLRDSIVTVETGAAHNTRAVEYEINVPRWMPVSIEVTNDDITIEGTESDVSAESIRGRISITGGAGAVHGESVEGKVLVSGVKARVDVSSVNDEIKVDHASGEISAETTNGAITLTAIDSASVEATTVNGSLTYEGTVADEGHYALATHNGDLVVSIPERSNVTIEVRTYNGSFQPVLAVKGTPPSRRGGRGVYTLGSGSAQMELESFGGSIRLASLANRK